MSEFHNAKIGRFDGELKSVAFRTGDKVAQLLDRAEISLSTGEEVNSEDGETISTSEEAQADAVYYIVGNFKNGLQK